MTAYDIKLEDKHFNILRQLKGVKANNPMEAVNYYGFGCDWAYAEVKNPQGKTRHFRR